jgi:hypothetical protein
MDGAIRHRQPPPLKEEMTVSEAFDAIWVWGIDYTYIDADQRRRLVRAVPEDDTDDVADGPTVTQVTLGQARDDMLKVAQDLLREARDRIREPGLRRLAEAERKVAEVQAEQVRAEREHMVELAERDKALQVLRASDSSVLASVHKAAVTAVRRAKQAAIVICVIMAVALVGIEDLDVGAVSEWASKATRTVAVLTALFGGVLAPLNRAEVRLARRYERKRLRALGLLLAPEDGGRPTTVPDSTN